MNYESGVYQALLGGWGWNGISLIRINVKSKLDLCKYEYIPN